MMPLITSARKTLRRVTLIVALFLASAAPVAAMPGSAPTAHIGTGEGPAVAHILPSDRAIMLIEGTDPANTGVTFILERVGDVVTPNPGQTPINLCVPCDGLA